LQIARRLTLTAYSLPSASAEEVGFYLQPKPISFGICSRFVSASSKLKSVAFPFGYQRPADGVIFTDCDLIVNHIMCINSYLHGMCMNLMSIYFYKSSMSYCSEQKASEESV
ncbi:TPA: hypothetical protein ACS90H_004862, partial [Salmonella enterica subsp. enterica serovar Rissen]